MSAEKTNRTKLLQVRLTPHEFQKIYEGCSHSTCNKLSDYARKKLLNKPITIYHRNQSLDDFMTELAVLIKELNALGNNYNQVVKRLHSLQHFNEVNAWAIINESSKKILARKVDEIKLKISQINDQWLQL